MSIKKTYTYTLFPLCVVLFVSFIAPAEAHRSGCHRWHSCPSDSGSYTCGDAGYPCRYPTYSESSGSVSGITTYTPPAPTPAPVFTFDEEWDFSSAVSSYSTAKDNITYWRNSAATSLYSSDYYNSLADGYEADIKKYEQTFLTTLKKAFRNLFGRAPDAKEADFWLGRIKRGEITTTDALLEKMGFQKAKGLTMPGHPIGLVAGATTSSVTIANKDVPAIVARLFQEVYGRSITPSESAYWKNRARSDKKTESALKGAMSFHKSKGINH